MYSVQVKNINVVYFLYNTFEIGHNYGIINPQLGGVTYATNYSN